MDRLSLLSVKVKSPEHQHMRYKTAILTTTLLPTCKYYWIAKIKQFEENDEFSFKAEVRSNYFTTGRRGLVQLVRNVNYIQNSILTIVKIFVHFTSHSNTCLPENNYDI
ncbi:hypothetical protein T4B_2773 [Trichinella pseudospiralis]|uniref:Uncharacterized protein n=1 Tax=Trichinella pseudospiralis TaxID=6337 RepID=A0A0V1IF52_TRIPS|nr:hypothetical protein T4B_2773 [Trichinella pseudospiralis]